MAVRTRVNEKTGRLQYKVRYLWYDRDGNRRDSMTGWFDSEKEALENASMLKLKREEASLEERDVKDSQTIKYVFSLFQQSLSEKANRDTLDNTTSDVSRYQTARTLSTYYMPTSIAQTKTRDLGANTFRKWLDHINICNSPKGKPLSGNSVRKYREILSIFNNYMADNGYYLDSELEVLIDNSIERMKIKSKKAGARKRYCPSISDMNKVFYHYVNNGIGRFQEFYWYTLFMTLFFSGMRSEEIIGLTWSNVHLDTRQPYIDVVNAISEREKKENVEKRMSAGIYHTKNNNSEREIPILEYYYDVLESYKIKMKQEFNIDDLGSYFVFPNINAKDKSQRATDYQKQKNILRELDRVCKLEDIPHFDVQMIRHACATWLVTDKEHGGMGYEESRARDFFGHTSDAMLRDVYAKLSKRQRANRTSVTFKDIAKFHAVSAYDDDIKESSEINQRVVSLVENSEDKFDAIYIRIQEEVFNAIDSGKAEYHYVIKEAPHVYYLKQLYLVKYNRNLDEEIKFVLDKTEMDEIWLADIVAENKALKEDDELKAHFKPIEEK